MEVTIEYEAQLRRAAGVRSETIELAEGCDVVECVRKVVEKHPDQLSGILLKADNQIQPSLLIFLNDSQILHDTTHTLSDGDTLTLMTPISGG